MQTVGWINIIKPEYFRNWRKVNLALMNLENNWEIMESFGNDVQATLDAAESGETPNSQYMEVTWQSY